MTRPQVGVVTTLIAVMVAAFVVVAPFFFRGTATGHDFDFHITSWMEAASQWRQGVFYPRWAVWAHYGFGEPRFLFYPPVSWLLGAALGCVLPWKAVPGALAWLALVLAGSSMYRLAREWLPANSAILAAVLYAVNPYHLVVVYVRSAYAELLASALFPLAVLCALRRDRASRPGIVPLALVFSAIWLTNAPVGVIASYGLLLLLLIAALLRRSAATLLYGGAAMALGLLLASAYIVPAAWERGWVKIAEVLSSGLRPEENFLFTSSSDPGRQRFLLLISMLATAQIGLTGVGALAAHKRGRGVFQEAREFCWGLLGLAAAAVALMLPVSAPAWLFLPELRYVQFPWRWLFPLGVAFAFFITAAIRQARVPRIWALLLAGALVAWGGYLVHVAWWDAEAIGEMQAAIAQSKGYAGTDEYDPRDADHYNLPTAAPLVAILSAEEGASPRAPARVQVGRWAPEGKFFTVEAPQSVVAAPRLLNYPAWRVEVKGQPAQADSHGDTGQMLVPLPAGRSRVRIWFARTADRTAGTALSGLAAAFLLGLALSRRRRAAAG